MRNHGWVINRSLGLKAEVLDVAFNQHEKSSHWTGQRELFAFYDELLERFSIKLQRLLERIVIIVGGSAFSSA